MQNQKLVIGVFIHPELSSALPDVPALRWYSATDEDIRFYIHQVSRATWEEEMIERAIECMRHRDRNKGVIL